MTPEPRADLPLPPEEGSRFDVEERAETRSKSGRAFEQTETQNDSRYMPGLSGSPRRTAKYEIDRSENDPDDDCDETRKQNASLNREIWSRFQNEKQKGEDK